MRNEIELKIKNEIKKIENNWKQWDFHTFYEWIIHQNFKKHFILGFFILFSLI
jgi:hypothetical protein